MPDPFSACTTQTYSTTPTDWAQGTGPFANQQYYFPIPGRISFPAGQHRIRYTCLAGTSLPGPGLIRVGFYGLASTLISCEEPGHSGGFGVSVGTVLTYQYPATDTGWTMIFQRNDATGVSGITAHNFRIEYMNLATETPCSPIVVVPCAFGVRQKNPGLSSTFFSTALAGLIAARFGSWLGVFLQPLIGTYLDDNEICAAPIPMPPPIFDIDMLLDPFGRLRKAVLPLVWFVLCECVPGTPTPTPPVDPVVNPPPGAPPLPTYGCSNSDICASLEQLLSRVDSLNRLVVQAWQLTNTMQRYELPFAYTAGAVHSALPQTGSFAVSRLLGMRAELVGPPPSFSLEGTPAYLWDLGWMSMSDGGGMLQEQRITRTSMDWLPSAMQLATTFGWYAKPGVSLKFTELQAEV